MNSEDQSPGFVLVLTGLRAEARIVAGVPKVRAVAGGGNAARAERLLGQGIAQGATGILSFGVAAGLEPGKRSGSCLIASEVIHGDTRYATEPNWTARLQAALGFAELGSIAGVDRPLQGQAEKVALRAETGAKASDMESHIAARVAAEQALPFAALRVIADPADRSVPGAAFAAMAEDGGINIRAMLMELARSPRDVLAMLRLSADMWRAMAALFRCRDRLGPGFSFGDLG